jgi:hypothetical protein
LPRCQHQRATARRIAGDSACGGTAAGPTAPNLGPKPFPIPTRRKKNPLSAPEIEGRSFAARMIAAGESASGFFYFNIILQHQHDINKFIQLINGTKLADNIISRDQIKTNTDLKLNRNSSCASCDDPHHISTRCPLLSSTISVTLKRNIDHSSLSGIAKMIKASRFGLGDHILNRQPSHTIFFCWEKNQPPKQKPHA